MSRGMFVFATVRQAADAASLKLQVSDPSLLHTVLVDITKDDDLAAAVEEVRQRLASDSLQLLGLVNNAGHTEMCPLELLTIPAMRAQLEANTIAPVAVTQHFLPLLREFASSRPQHRARIVFVSSLLGRIHSPGCCAYSASKHALQAIGESWRLELARFNIHVALIQPGSMRTKLLDKPTATGQSSIHSAAERGLAAVTGQYTAALEKRAKRLATTPFESPEWFSDAVEAALLENRPLATYACGWTSLGIHLVCAMPQWIADRMVGGDYA